MTGLPNVMPTAGWPFTVTVNSGASSISVVSLMPRLFGSSNSTSM